MGKPKRIDLETISLRRAVQIGMGYFQPYLGCKKLPDLECGTTVRTTSNALWLLDRCSPRTVFICDDWRGVALDVVLDFESPEGDAVRLPATGFGVGYSGEGPRGLATFCEKTGFAGYVEALERICTWTDKPGILYAETLDREDVVDVLSEVKAQDA